MQSQGRNALLMACTWGAHEAVQLLVQHSADVNHESSQLGLNPLKSCLMRDNLRTARFLLDSGADLLSTKRLLSVQY